MRYTDRLISSPPQLERPVIWGAPTRTRLYSTRELDLSENTVSEGRTIKFQSDGVVTGITAAAQTYQPLSNHAALQVVKNGRDALFSTGRERIRVPTFALASQAVLFTTARPTMVPVWIPVRRGEIWRMDCQTFSKHAPEDTLGYVVTCRVEEWLNRPEPPSTITETVFGAAKIVCPIGQTATEQIHFVRDAVVTGIFLISLPYGVGVHPQVQVIRAGVSPFGVVLEDTVPPELMGWEGGGAHEFPVCEPVQRDEAWKVSISNGGAEEKTVWAVFRVEEQRREPW